MTSIPIAITVTKELAMKVDFIRFFCEEGKK